MRALIAGNWKMHGLKAQLGEIRAIAASVRASPPNADILICPPATLIDRAVQAADGAIAIGGQDCHREVTGAHTGDVSAQMLKDDGASAVIVGHSERRKAYAESDDVVAAKALAATRAGLMAIVCVGESQAVREAGKALAFCAGQVEASIPPGLTGADCAVAYEPLWAIGGQRAARPEEIVDMHAHIRQVLIHHLGAAGALVRILYGGSVTAANAAPILALPEVNGALVGRESLAFANFDAIIAAASATLKIDSGRAHSSRSSRGT
jgi:triosephosphate isomerase